MKHILPVIIALLFTSPVFASDPPIDYQQTTDIQQIKKDVADMRKKIDSIYCCLKGNGKPGLETRTALNEGHAKINSWGFGVILIAMISMWVGAAYKRRGNGGCDG